MKFADVYLPFPLDKTFTYAVPEEQNVLPGSRVRVNFNNRITTAFVSETHSSAPEGFDCKNILSVVDSAPIFDSRLVDLAGYVASNYVCSVGEVLGMALPSGKKPSKRYKIPFAEKEKKEIELTADQKSVYNDIIGSYNRDDIYHLIFGITGSGKTEVYIELANYFIKKNKSVIYLVPEISLSSQVFERLHNVFGKNLVIYHSQLSANQRLYNWNRFFTGDAKIAIGTRSAAFMQCPDLGLIIIDEEHDGSYKEHSTPRYNARRIAFYRCKRQNAALVMGSATPSIESLYSAEKGLLRLHQLKNRIGQARLPEIEIVKINAGKRGPSDMLSSILKLYSKKAIDNGNQTIFLLNRRGFSPFIICGDCGTVFECPNCSIGLNLHNNGYMLCHYCGYRAKMPEVCPDCGSENIERVGSGTQRIEKAISDVFSTARIFRLDRDSSQKKNTVFDLIKKINSGDIDILIGTQMVAKGFDFHNVSVVGVILADIGLNLPDFRAQERIFSLLIQVAGRCGRGEVPGRVIIQTLNENNRLFSFLKNHDYMGFYRYELSVRKMLEYPPFSRIARLLIRGHKEERVISVIENLAAGITGMIREKNSRIKMLGPSQAPLGKISKNYRYHIIMKSHDMKEMKEIIMRLKEEGVPRDVYLEIDIDPFDML